ncbi:methylenetetrahydrofolate reductase C-terminal domain-containing protein [Marisediminicola sp. LYQ85]|uniref:methylenetetrahydrofolate reductase C-terminal domain-containing protein n=1 Tax=Marisediminicola sp. LYQ85 TaxID=3391062 RepID=UPI0039835A91
MPPETEIVRAPECPKSMEFGPCGGVEGDGRCEVAEHACVFLDVDTVRWSRERSALGPPARDTSPTPHTPADRMRALLGSGRVVVGDFPARALDADSIRECADILAGSTDAVLAGDSARSRVQFSPTYRAQLIRAAGLEVWTGLNCRDRNRVALEGELAGLAHVGVSGVHCVTGDHTATGSRPDARPVFDLDSTRLAAVARAAGHLVSVGESPATPPMDRRAERLREKERAGAEVCFVNHAGGVEPVRAFIAEARALGSGLRFIACVPIVVDVESAALLASFPSLVLPPGYLDGIFAADSPTAAGISAAIELSRRLLDVDGVAGVNLSGGGGAGGELRFADALAEVGSALRS